ncbi:MAG: hypothetical protein ABW019_10455 [Chitinophagaceae bacterium]
MTKTCLIIVFNHRYDKNIPVLEKIYAGRFSAVYFLVPFYDGHHPQVIPVYESSNYFQSFFAQGYHRFFREEFTHYLFLGDDCILNPALNESNLLQQTGLPADADFISGLIDFSITQDQGWWHAFKGIDFFTNRKGAEIKRELPDREEAVKKFAHHGLTVRPLSAANIFGMRRPPHMGRWQYWGMKQFYYRFKWKNYRKNGRIELPYPVAGSYADIVIATKESVYDFCRYCGIMAAAGLFVEIAIPTAMILASQKIAQEKDLRLQGKALWSAPEVEAVEKKHNRSLRSLQNGFPADQLYYHPVKLSKWDNDL